MKNHLLILFAFLLSSFSIPLALDSSDYNLDFLNDFQNLIFTKSILPMFLEPSGYHHSVSNDKTQLHPDRESDENEPTTDLPIIDSPCQSDCPPNYKICIYICN